MGEPPHVRVLGLISGMRVAQVVYTLTELGIPDALAGGPRTVAELAAVAGTHEESLGRLLRAAAAIGVLSADAQGRFAGTDLSGTLRAGTPGSVRDLVLFNASELENRPWRELTAAVRTGEPVFERLFGCSFFEHIGAHPDAGTLFDRAMTQMSVSSTAAFLGRYDFGTFTRLVDVGGGRGHFLASLLQRYPHVHGVLADQPSVVAAARILFKQRGVDERVTIAPTDFFDEVPPGADAYVLKNVLHDWPDADAARIVRTVRAAMRPDSLLLVCESVLAPPGQWDPAALFDLDMMLKFGSRERDLGSWRNLLAASGFKLVNEPSPGTRAVLACQPI